MSAPPAFRVVERCRVCAGGSLEPILDLGATPLANAFVRPGTATEDRYALELIRCATCGLVQLSIVVDPEVMFRSYAYSSSASPPLLEHFDALAEDLVGRFAPAGSFVAEIGSNDGVLLRPLVARGVRALGVEPAGEQAAIANAAGLETVNTFFSSGVAGELESARGRARAVVATNVLAHVDDLRDVMIGLDRLLDRDGVFVAEVPYLVDLLDHVEYDTVYHEHLSYFAVGPLRRLFADAGFELFEVRRLPIHGGSIRVHAGRKGARPVGAEVEAMVEAEERAGLHDASAYRRFAERVFRSREALRELLDRLKAKGHGLAGYGATAKGNTLLNYCRIGPELIEFIADTTPQKQGLLTPGTRIPVVAEARFLEQQPDYTLLLAWNYADAIVRRRADYVARGGRFIHPIPLAKVI